MNTVTNFFAPQGWWLGGVRPWEGPGESVNKQLKIRFGKPGGLVEVKETGVSGTRQSLLVLRG